MTHPEQPEIPLGKLADAMHNEDGETDYIAIYEALKPYLMPDDFKQLGAMLELCPLHFCDIRICADDGLHGDEVYQCQDPQGEWEKDQAREAYDISDPKHPDHHDTYADVWDNREGK